VASAARRLATPTFGRGRGVSSSRLVRGMHPRLEPDCLPRPAPRCQEQTAVMHGWPTASAGGCTRSVTWGSASADRSIIARENGLGFAVPSSSEEGATKRLGFGRERLWRAASAAFDCRLVGNDKKATGRSDAVLAVDEGKSSKGVNRVAGKAPRARHRPPGRLTGPGEPGNATNPGPAAGCNRPANQQAE